MRTELMAYAEHIVTLHAPIKVRRTMTIDGVERTGLVEATVGASSSIILFLRIWVISTVLIPSTGWSTRSASA